MLRLTPSTKRRRFHHGSGFTLLEVCIAMTIGLLIIGVATLGISGIQEEQSLRRLASGIETTVRESLQEAVASHRHVFLELDGGRLSTAAHQGQNQDGLSIDGALTIRRYGEKKFRAPRRGEVWKFTADGLCEPIELRVTQSRGTVEMSFDPLTGCARKKSIIVKS